MVFKSVRATLRRFLPHTHRDAQFQRARRRRRDNVTVSFGDSQVSGCAPRILHAFMGVLGVRFDDSETEPTQVNGQCADSLTLTDEDSFGVLHCGHDESVRNGRRTRNSDPRMR